MTFAELFKNKTNENGEDEAACVSPLFRSVSQARGFSWEIRDEAVTPRNSEPVCESFGVAQPCSAHGKGTMGCLCCGDGDVGGQARPVRCCPPGQTGRCAFIHPAGPTRPRRKRTILLELGLIFFRKSNSVGEEK